MSDYSRIHYLKQHNLKESEIDEPSSTIDLNAFLLNEQKNNKSATWSKLTKMNKIYKLNEYTEQVLKEKNELTNEEVDEIKKYLKVRLDRKKLGNAKEIIYNKEEQKIKDIPGFLFNKQTRNFTLKNQEKRASSLKNLPNYKKIQKSQQKEQQKEQKTKTSKKRKAIVKLNEDKQVKNNNDNKI